MAHEDLLSLDFGYKHTCFKLDPDSCIILDLLDHFSVPADHDAHGEPGNGDLQRDRLQLSGPLLAATRANDAFPCVGILRRGWTRPAGR